MARVHFTLRALERRTGEPARVKAVFGEFVDAARARRRIGRGTKKVSGLLTVS
jgi:hypothetical protein